MPHVGQRLGSLIVAVGGLLFVLVNAGSLGAMVSAVLRVVAVVAFGAVVTLLTSAVAAAATSVVAGFVLLGFSASFAVVQRRRLSDR